jgi:hypothetical protein
MALGAEVVDLIGSNIPQYLVQRASIIKVAVMEEESCGTFVRILIDMVDSAGVERR